jgi:hypothetical protein
LHRMLLEMLTKPEPLCRTLLFVANKTSRSPWNLHLRR